MSRRILLCINGKTYGGAEKMTMSLASYLKKEHHVELLLNANEYVAHEAYSDYKKHLIYKVNFSSKLKPLHYIIQLCLFIKLLIYNKYDLILFENKYLMQVGIPVAKFLNKRVYVYVHFPISKYELNRCYYQYSDKIILCCKSLDKYFVPKHKFSEKINLLYNYVDPVVHLRSKNESNEIIISCIGHISEIKGQAQIIEIAKQFNNPNLTFYLIGGINPENNFYYQECINLIRMYDLQDRVILTGKIDSPNELLAKTDIYIQPSNAEGLPLSILEAMANSLPIVGYDIDGIAEAIKDGHNGFLVKQNDLEGLKESLSKLIDSPKMRKDFGANSLNYFMENYTKKQFMENVNSIFLE